MSLTLDAALARFPGAVPFRYGDGADLNAEILALVRAGRKTVTCDAWDAFAARGEPLPVEGRVDVALDWTGAPQVAVQTLKVEKIRFCDMDEARVQAMAEFTDLADWTRGYERYLRRSGFFAPDVEMMVETFTLVEDFAL